MLFFLRPKSVGVPCCHLIAKLKGSAVPNCLFFRKTERIVGSPSVYKKNVKVLGAPYFYFFKAKGSQGALLSFKKGATISCPLRPFEKEN